MASLLLVFSEKINTNLERYFFNSFWNQCPKTINTTYIRQSGPIQAQEPWFFFVKPLTLHSKIRGGTTKARSSTRIQHMFLHRANVASFASLETLRLVHQVDSPQKMSQFSKFLQNYYYYTLQKTVSTNKTETMLNFR